MLCHLSYSGFRHWQDSNLQPMDYDVTRAYTTPQTFQNPHTPPVFPANHAIHSPTLPEKLREERSAHEFRSRARALLMVGKLSEVAVNFTIPGRQFP
jgi:hypothetical protein